MKTSRWMVYRFFLCLFSMSVLTFGAQAQMLSKPTGPVVLTVGGNISQRNAGNFAEFDAEMLDNLPVTEFSTTSPWHNTSVIYSGPSLSAVLQAVGAQGKVLNLMALNKYEIQVPFNDAADFSPILARRANGKGLVIRTKGPLLMIYPFDSKPQLKNDVYYSRSIWQLQRIMVE
jgi:hypothetical protein